jgi:hypothetical protein
MSSDYRILSTQPAVYQDKVDGVVNGVLVRFTIPAYDEVHEVRVPKMDVTLVKQVIESLVAQRDELAALGKAAE